MSLRNDIEQTRKQLKISEVNFREVQYFVYENILKQIGEQFTELGKRAAQYFWFNHNLKGDVVSFMLKSEEDVTEILKGIISANPTLWFIGAETYKARSKYWVYESDLNSALAILDEMYLFDFYLVDKKSRWLVTEEHHGVLLAVGSPVALKLQRYKDKH